MAKINYNDIQDINVSWENYAGSSVEKFIKKELNSKAGYIYRSRTKEGDFYYLYGFTNYEQYVAWSAGESVIPLFKVQLPNIENDIYSANLYTNSRTDKLVNLGQGIKIGLRYTSTATNPSTGAITDTYNEGTLIISRSANGSAFTEVGRLLIQPIEHNSDTYTTVDITRFLADGDNQIRLRVEDNVNGAVSNNIVFKSIVNTTLKVTNATDTSKTLSNAQFMYYIEGQVAKTLNLEVTQNGNVDNYSFPIGSSTFVEAPYIVTLSKEYDNGTIEVETWLSVDDTVLESEHIVNQFYYLNGTSDETVIILNNKATAVTNYSNVHFFDFTLFNNPSEVNIKVQDGSNIYLDYTENYDVNTEYSFYNVLQIESVQDTINAFVTVTTNSSSETYTITIDNSEKMSPTANADFILNPNKRNNTESTPNRIINDASGLEVLSSFNGFNFINDGWVSDDDGYKVLRVPSEHYITISYDPLDNLINGTTIELDYKVYNVFNDSDVVFSFDSQTQDEKPLGFIMNATEAAFYTVNNQVKRDQDVMFQEEVRTHLAINIIPNLANSGLNYIRIFINGVMNREMLYKSSDIFKNGTLNIKIGSQNCDMDIYSIRIYKKALSASDVRQDYLSTIPTLEGKLAFKAANDILSANGTISFDKASVKYNTLVWTGQLPSLATGNVEYYGDLEVNILGDLEHSGKITGLRDKGQGSSSRTYWKWNQQYDWNKDGHTTVWTDGNGNVHTDGYKLTENDPAATKLVAKLNWASSMQSHKLGSTALYTDLWREIVGGNSITKTEGYEDARVSVREKPFLFFVKSSEFATPVFYGLMTFGSGKYDKATFGYDKNVFPDYLILEGSDNGMPLTNRQVPWFEDEVTYNDDKEYYEYAGAGNLDYGMGNQNMLPYFINAFNFAYEHAIRLQPYTNDSELLDSTYQYWNTATGNIVRYDYISKEWVNGGITKTNGEYDTFNIFTQTSITPSGDANADNEAFKQWRINDFKNKVELYYNLNDVIYSMSFLKFIAASDNRCKNTYEYLDPVTHKICLAQDDMDTILLTDNVGRKTKPYYVEEYDTYTLDNQINYYFNGQDNNFFALMDAAFNTELRQTMKSIFTQMNTVKFGQSAEQCLQNYFYDVQEYFPAVAYNETARLLYEEASVAQEKGVYQNGTPAISQSLGNQLEAEKQWFKRRLRYLQSWSSADPFDVRSVGSPALNFRSVLTSQGLNPSYQFTLKPWQWLYPKVGVGQTLGADNARVQAQTAYNTITLTTDGNTDTFVYGADYYISLGEFGEKSIGETFQLAGKRLLEFSADSRQVNNYEFKPTAMTINCPVLKRLTIYGCTRLSGELDLSNETKLISVDLRNTSLTSVSFPQSGNLSTIYIPNLTSIFLVNCPNVTEINAESYSNLISLTTDNSTLALQAVSNANNLANIDLRNININISDATVSNKMYSLLVADGNDCSGRIQLNKVLTVNEKTILVNKYGNIDSVSNPLYIQYVLNPSDSISLMGGNQLAQGKTAYYYASYSGNDIYNYDWTVTNAATYSVNGNGCTITAKDDSLEDIEVTLTVSRVNNNSLTVQKTIEVIENIAIEGLANTDCDCSNIGYFTIPFIWTPSNYTIPIANINVTLANTPYAHIDSYDENQLTLECTSKVTDTIQSSLVTVNAIDDEGNEITDSFNVNFTNPVNTIILNGTTSIWTRN